MSDDKAKTAAMGALTQYLTQHKLRKTPERYTILEKVFDMSDHFSVETLNAALHADGYHVSCTTVYNTLELLAEASLVRRRTFGRQPAHYEKIAGLSNHHHLVCTRCGKVREVKDQTIDTMLSSLRFGTFRPAYADLYIYGVCSRCARKKRTAADSQSSKENTTNVKKQHNRS
ncbi:transcriptional repressor [Muribaculaceae bacterium Isolate-104 (HZI)]|jgi:Fur family ferric uptake transcriptional regulator|nr:transcriptional repressor [Muribaculaceae bacterium Isolate-104 (HZI)]